MLNQHEQRIWDEIEQAYPAEADDVARRHLGRDANRTRRAGQVAEVPSQLVAGVAVVVLGLWATVVLLAIGAFIAAVVVGLATALAWRFWPLLREPDRENPLAATEPIAHARADAPAADDPVAHPGSRSAE